MIVLRLKDKNGNYKDEKGNAYGFFLEDEEELAKAYCEAHDLEYEKERI